MKDVVSPKLSLEVPLFSARSVKSPSACRASIHLYSPVSSFLPRIERAAVEAFGPFF